VGIWLSSVPSFCRPSSARRQRVDCPAGCPAHTHLAYKLIDGLVDGILAKVKLGGDALRLISKCHAALGSGVEGASELDVLLEDNGVRRRGVWGRDAPMLGPVEDFADRVREAGREES
jgi:hypothetical protein